MLYQPADLDLGQLDQPREADEALGDKRWRTSARVRMLDKPIDGDLGQLDQTRERNRTLGNKRWRPSGRVRLLNEPADLWLSNRYPKLNEIRYARGLTLATLYWIGLLN